MAQILKLCPQPHHSPVQSLLLRSPLYASRRALIGNPNPRWTSLQEQLKCDGRCTCLSADGRKREQAGKALENARGEKKTEFEKWNNEIQKREESGGGGASGGGGCFGGGGWFGWFSGDHFWDKAQPAIIAIVSLCLLLAMGRIMYAIVSDILLSISRECLVEMSFGFGFFILRSSSCRSHSPYNDCFLRLLQPHYFSPPSLESATTTYPAKMSA